jgi:hypothetical protein
LKNFKNHSKRSPYGKMGHAHESWIKKSQG